MKRGQFPPVTLTVFLLLTLGLPPVFADASTSSSPGRTVFIDPGHGGDDFGAAAQIAGILLIFWVTILQFHLWTCTDKKSVVENPRLTIGAWRSLVARLLWEQEAGGSNPLAPTNYQMGSAGEHCCVTTDCGA